MFLFADTVDDANTGRFIRPFIGVVRSVESNTSLTLQAVSPYSTGTTGYTLTSIRGFQYKIAKGRITSTTTTTTITGANTKFISQGMDEVFSAQSGAVVSGLATITGLASTTSLKSGMRVTGANIPAGAFILTVDSGTQVTMSANATGSDTSVRTFKHGWNLYRASDMGWIGRVVLVNNELSITINANATLALNNERFFALCGTGDWSLSTAANVNKPGFLNATYANRQWYANNGQRLELISRIWFSETGDPEAVDLSPFDGDFIDLSSSVGTDTPIKAIVPAHNALVTIKENETFAVSGSDPTTFSSKKILDDGTLSGMSAQSYGGGVVWAGRDGIHYYDGVQVNNLTEEKLGDYYKNALRGLDPSVYRMWSMIIRDHYFLFIENFSPNVAVVKGAVSYTPTATTIVINMVTGAVSLWTNLNVRGAIETPADSGKQTLYLVNNATRAYICYGFDLFDQSGADTLLCDSGSSAAFYNLGVTTQGTATAFAGAADKKYFSKVILPTRASIQSIRVLAKTTMSPPDAQFLRAGIYSDVGGAPSALLGSTVDMDITGTLSQAFINFAFTNPIELAPGTYWIGVHNHTTNSTFYQEATPFLIVRGADTYSGGLSDPFGSDDGTLNGPLVAYAVLKTVGPDFYLETKKFSESDAMRKKLFKQLAVTYMVQGDTLRLDTVPGLNTVGKTSGTVFPITVYTWDQIAAIAGTWESLSLLYPTWDSVIQANYAPKRIKFLKRSQLLSIRLWQNSPAVTRLQIGPFQLGFKWMRPGRI